MKKVSYLFTTLAFVLVFGGNAFGQVTASAEIVSPLTTGDRQNKNINFGQLLNNSSEDVTIDPNADPQLVNTGSAAQIGELDIDGSAGSTVLITITDPTELVLDTDNTKSISFIGKHAGSETHSISTTDADITSGTSVSRDLSGSGDYYLFLGGTLAGNEIQGATEGSYTGTITVTVEYQ